MKYDFEPFRAIFFLDCGSSMLVAPDIPNDESRLAALYALNLLDTPPEERFDRFTRLANQVFDVPIALISLVDVNRQWFKSCYGLDAKETGRDISFCGHAILEDKVFVIENATEDPRFADNPLVTGEPAIRFYAGQPLRAIDGSLVGTLCLIDRKPRKFDEDAQRTLTDIARMLETELNIVTLAELHQTLVQTQASERRARQERDRLFENALDLQCVAGLDGYFHRVNPMFLKTLGYGEKELLETPFIEFIHPDDREATNKVLESLGEGSNVVDFENRYRCKDGTYRWLSWSCPATSSEDPLIYAIARDITADKANRKLIRESQAQLREAKESAESANRAKSEFLANMSHEIRTPMNAVIGMTDMVLETSLTDSQRDYLKTVSESAGSLMSLINEMLDFSKIEAGKLRLEHCPFVLREFLGDTLKSLAMRAHAKGLELAWRVDADVPDSLVADPTRLRQLIVNLIGNSIKFTKAGEIVLTVSRQHPNAEIVEGGPVDLLFCVRDTGIGIPPDRLESIFEAFQQADASTTRRFGGTGLGLAISLRILELMNGEICVESEVDQGSSFVFKLPLEVRAPDEDHATDSKLRLIESTEVLVVDDNLTNQTILRDTLTAWGLEVTTASSGHDAIDLFRDGDAKIPDLALVDLHMPDIDGFNLVRSMRRMESLKELKVIMLSVGARKGDAHLCRELKIARNLLKPVKPSELLDAIVATLHDQPVPAVEPEKAVGDSGEVDRGKLHVLLVEDGFANQKLAVGMLKRWGHEVTVANNGVEAIEKLTDGPYDLILMDVQMPEMDGFEATREIRRLESVDERISIIAMTAHAMPGDRENCLEAGMDGYLTKPIIKQELLDALQNVATQ